MMRKKWLREWLVFGVLFAMLTAMLPASVWAAGKAGAATDTAAEQQSQKQIVQPGGSSGSLEEDGVEISKTITPTGNENVFDIDLQVKTTQDISEIYGTPDAAVVIVMDISNTMNEKFPQGSSTSRYCIGSTDPSSNRSRKMQVSLTSHAPRQHSAVEGSV